MHPELEHASLPDTLHTLLSHCADMAVAHRRAGVPSPDSRQVPACTLPLGQSGSLAHALHTLAEHSALLHASFSPQLVAVLD